LLALHAREPEPGRRAHALAVEAIMRELARRLHGDGEQWAMAGLLHDIDLAETRTNPSQHGIVGARLVLALGFGDAVAQAVASHDDQAGVPRRDPMDHALYCADRAFWAIRSSGVDLETGAGIATPGAVIDGLRRKSVRDRIDGKFSDACGALGLTIEELLSVSLAAMRSVPLDPG
jgi:putative nucleotidyltransferase with HDIG domain